MQLLAALAGSLWVAFTVYVATDGFRFRYTLALLPLVLAVGWFIGRGRDMAWVRAWGCMAATALPWATLLFYMAFSFNKLPTRNIGDAFVLPALTWTFAALGAMLLGACLLFLLLAVWQRKRVKRRRIFEIQNSGQSGKPGKGSETISCETKS